MHSFILAISKALETIILNKHKIESLEEIIKQLEIRVRKLEGNL